jgi:hypothetical protein
MSESSDSPPALLLRDAWGPSLPSCVPIAACGVNMSCPTLGLVPADAAGKVESWVSLNERQGQPVSGHKIWAWMSCEPL